MRIVVSKIPKPLATTVKLKDRALMQEIGDFVVNDIRQRTDDARGVDGRFFPALSPAYAKRKQAELGSTRPDLSVSGDMLNAMKATVLADGRVQVGFVGGGASSGGGGTFIQRSRGVAPAEKARFHNVVGAGASKVIRKFLGLSQQARKTINGFVREHLNRQVAKYNGGGR